MLQPVASHATASAKASMRKRPGVVKAYMLLQLVPRPARYVGGMHATASHKPVSCNVRSVKASMLQLVFKGMHATARVKANMLQPCVKLQPVSGMHATTAITSACVRHATTASTSACDRHACYGAPST